MVALWTSYSTPVVFFLSSSFSFFLAYSQRSQIGCLLYWQRYCTALQQRASAKLCGVVQAYKEWNYGTFAEGATYIRLGGHLVGRRRTFYTVEHKKRGSELIVNNFIKS